MKNNKDVTFIRKGGKVIPIKKDKDRRSPAAKSRQYEAKASKHFKKFQKISDKNKKFGLMGLAGGSMAGYVLGGKKKLAASIIGGLAGSIVADRVGTSKEDRKAMNRELKAGFRYSKKASIARKKINK